MALTGSSARENSTPFTNRAVPLAILGAIVLLALVLRIVKLDEPAVFDELYLYEVVHGRSLQNALDIVVDTESTPPLYFVVAWVAAKVGGDDLLWIKVPSLLASVATVPVIYWVGARSIGKKAALIGSAFFALAPFAIFYGTEGRGYATLILLSALSTGCLFQLVQTGRKGWAVGLAVASAGVAYTHYTGVFMAAAQLLLGALVYRESRRPILLAGAGAVLLYLPWLPAFFTQREENTADRLEQYELTLRTVVETLGRVSIGHPLAPLGTVPGLGWVLIAAGMLIALVVGLRQLLRSRELSISNDLVLLVGIALASPIGAWIYSLGPENVYGPRYLSASVPAFAVLVGACLGSLPGLARVTATAAVLVGVVVGTVRTLEPETQRARFDTLAREVDRRAAPGVPVAEPSFWYGAPSRQLGFYFERPHDYFPNSRPFPDALTEGRRAGELFVVFQGNDVSDLERLFMAKKGFIEKDRQRHPGTPPLTLIRYVPERQ